MTRFYCCDALKDSGILEDVVLDIEDCGTWKFCPYCGSRLR
jgi:hypothetical protein